MKYAKLGNTNLEVSRIGYGCMSLAPQQKDFESLINAAINEGINYFDTADLYDKGENERLLGKALKGKRDQVILATKAGNQWRADGSGWDWNPRKNYIIQCAEDSLRRLQTDYIDVFQLHGGTIEDNIEESIEAFEWLKKQGKIRHYGLSSIRPNVIQKHIDYGTLVSVMIQYSLLDRRPEEQILDLLKEKNIGVLVRGSVASGLLAGKPAKPYLNWNTTEVAHTAKALDSMSTPERNAAETAISYVLHHPAVTSVIVGMRTKEQIEEAIKAEALPPITSQEYLQMSTQIPVNRYIDHR